MSSSETPSARPIPRDAEDYDRLLSIYKEAESEFWSLWQHQPEGPEECTMFEEQFMEVKMLKPVFLNFSKKVKTSKPKPWRSNPFVEKLLRERDELKKELKAHKSLIRDMVNMHNDMISKLHNYDPTKQ